MSAPADNFTREDFVRSRLHPELEIPLEDLGLTLTINAMRVLLLFMQPARSWAGALAVLSFCRNLLLNKAVKGKDDSDHLDGLACDFKPIAMTAEEFLDAAVSGELAEAGAVWDKLNLYSESKTFHVALKLAGQTQRMRVYVDWELVNQ